MLCTVTEWQKGPAAPGHLQLPKPHKGTAATHPTLTSAATKRAGAQAWGQFLRDRAKARRPRCQESTSTGPPLWPSSPPPPHPQPPSLQTRKKSGDLAWARGMSSTSQGSSKGTSPQELPSRAALELGAKKTEAGIRSSLSTSSEHMLPKLGPARDENGKARLLPSQLLSSALQALATKPPPLAAWGKVHSSLISSSAPLFHLHLIPLDPWLRKCSSSFSMSMIISTDAREARAPPLKPPSCPCPLPGLQK